MGSSFCRVLLVVLLCLAPGSCDRASTGREHKPGSNDLGVMTIGYGANAQFVNRFLTRFAAAKHVGLTLIPPTETVKSRISLYQQLFAKKASRPDLFEIDVVWASALADSLIDLTPYFQDELRSFDPDVVRNFKVGNKVVAIPTFLDLGVLFYRPELLARYGYRQPPATWGELESMAGAIQTAERRKGNKNFWGYVWQGGAYEALTCNALEWQTSSGSPPFVDDTGGVHVSNPETISALKRAASWIGRISPPGEPFYREMDATNLWDEGNTAFMRSWISSYRIATPHPGRDKEHFRVAPLPAGPGGHRGTLGGLGMGVSRFSLNRDLAIEALRGLTSVASETEQTQAAGTIPTRTSLRHNQALMDFTALPGSIAQRAMSGLVLRPGLSTGETYPEISQAYYSAVHSVLTHTLTPEQSMQALEKQLLTNPKLHKP